MLGALAMALCASLCWGVADVMAGLQTRRLSILSVLVVSQPFGLLAGALWVGIAGAQRPATGALLSAFGAGIAGTLGLGALWLAMAIGMFGLASPISATGVLIPLAYGLLRGEALTTVALIGAALAIGGVLVAVSTPAAGDSRPQGRMAPSNALAAGAALCFGLLFTGIGVAAEHSPAWALLAARAGGSAAVAVWLALALARTRRRPPIPRVSLPALALVGALETGGSALYALAAHSGHVGLAAVAASLYPAVTVLIAALLLGERLGVAQRAGVLVIILGVAMIGKGG